MLNISEIQNILPHRYPFLLIDKIEELVPGEKAVGYKNVTMNEYFFQGHFIGEPIMPGVLIIEALAQVGAAAILSLDEYKGKIGYFAGIDKARFRRKVIPGDVLKLQVEITNRMGKVGKGKAEAYVDGEKAAEAILTFVIGD